MKKTKALGKMHLSLFPILFLEEIFLHFFPHSIYPYFFLPTSRCHPWLPSFAEVPPVHVFPSSPPPPHCLCSPSAPETPSWTDQGGESDQSGPTLGPALILA